MARQIMFQTLKTEFGLTDFVLWNCVREISIHGCLYLFEKNAKYFVFLYLSKASINLSY